VQSLGEAMRALDEAVHSLDMTMLSLDETVQSLGKAMRSLGEAMQALFLTMQSLDEAVRSLFLAVQLQQSAFAHFDYFFGRNAHRNEIGDKMKKTLFIIVLLFASLIRASDIPTSLSEADSLLTNHLKWFSAETGYWPLFFNECPKPPHWEENSVIGIGPIKIRERLKKEGFDENLSDFDYYKAFIDTLFPFDSTIIPDTVNFVEPYPEEKYSSITIYKNPKKVIWARFYLKYTYFFDESGNLIKLNWHDEDSYSNSHHKWDNRGNLIYSDYWSGPSGDNSRFEREYDESNRLRTERRSYLNGNPEYCLREFDDNEHVTIEVIENDSLKYLKTYDYDENGNTKRIDIAFMMGDKDAKSDTLFTKTTFFDLTMAKMNPNSGFGIDSIKTTGDEGVLEKYKRFIGH